VRALLATAGLLVLAGSAAAARPTAHTLRKSSGGPIVAVAQDGGFAAWLTYSSPKGPCNAVHVLSPGKHDRTLPQPASDSTTCRWVLTDGQPQLALASRMSTALWTLHEGGPSPLDYVMAASVGGPEHQVGLLAHTTDGTGKWLGGVAGSGKTLAYSWDDVEYVDPSQCLSTGICKQKIADGGIDVVTRTNNTPSAAPLPGAKPALQLAAAGGRIAYIPATTVKAGRPSANTNNSVYLVDATSGNVEAQESLHGIPVALALTSHVLAVLTTQGAAHDRISWYSVTDGSKLGSVVISGRTSPQLGEDDQLIVYRVGRLLRDVSIHNGRTGKLVKTPSNAVGLSLARGRLLWAENRGGDSGRLRMLAVR
jgi:hypothetical protein